MKYKTHLYQRYFSRLKRMPGILRVRYKRVSLEQNRQQIVFVVPHFSPRVVKIMAALTELNYAVVVLCERPKKNLFFDQIEMRACRIHYYASKEEALYWCLQYKPLVYHVFCCYGYIIAQYLIRKKVGKVVFDNYDGYAGFLAEWDQSRAGVKKTALEKYCLENADGLCCRSFESQYQKRHFHYQLRGKRIFFPDYCWGELEDAAEKNEIAEGSLKYDRDILQSSRLKFFYCGGIAASSGYPYDSSACNVELAEVLDKNQICYHIFASNYNSSLQGEEIKCGDSLAYFGFYPPVPFAELHSLERTYDYGTYLFTQGFRQKRKDRKVDGIVIGVKYQYAATNKFFDYIDAGLPIIASAPALFLQIFKRYGMAHYATLESIEGDLDYLEENLPRFKQNIEKNIRKLSIMENIPRLIRFYQDI